MSKSDHQPVLIVSGLVEGTYNYTLTVTSRQGMEASDRVTIHVLPNPIKNYLLLVQLEMEPSVFSIAKQVYSTIHYPLTAYLNVHVFLIETTGSGVEFDLGRH